MRIGLVAAAAILAAALPVAAHAADAQPAPAAAAPEQGGLPGMEQLMKFIAQPAYFDMVGKLALNGEHDLTPKCQAKVLGRAGMTVLELPEFQAGKDAPVGGSWKDQVLVDRCGPKVIHNVIVDARPDGLHVGLLMPGETGAPRGLQPGVVQAVAETSLHALKCKDSNTFVVTDTRKHKLLKEMKVDDKGRLAAGEWNEVWSTRACGKEQPVLVTFTADGTGHANYTAKAFHENAGKKK